MSYMPYFVIRRPEISKISKINATRKKVNSSQPPTSLSPSPFSLLSNWWADEKTACPVDTPAQLVLSCDYTILCLRSRTGQAGSADESGVGWEAKRGQ